MTAKQTRPAGNRTGQEAFRGADTILPDATPDGTDTRPRCAGCGHVLTAPRSVARAYGPVCWLRTARGQLDARRDAAGRSLGRLARRVASLDVAGLALVSAALDDAVDALDALDRMAGGAR